MSEVPETVHSAEVATEEPQASTAVLPPIVTETASKPEPEEAAAAEPAAPSDTKPEESTPVAPATPSDKPAPVSPTTGVAPDPAAVAPFEKSGEEPQNALTRKFTDEEWTALKALREKLGDVFAEAYADKPTARTTPITLWGVTLDPSGRNDARASVILVKFLRARNLDVNSAKEMLVATLKWRAEFKVDDIMKEEFPDEVFGKLGRVRGRDKEGRPISYNLYGANQNVKEVFEDVQRFIRWRVKFMEESIKLLDFETVDQMVQVHDYEGVSFMSRDANQKAAASEATNIFQTHYPEFLSTKFFINVPSMLTWIFWIFKPLISAKTLAKFHVVGTGPRTIGAALLPVIDAQELPKRYGGQAEDLL